MNNNFNNSKDLKLLNTNYSSRDWVNFKPYRSILFNNLVKPTKSYSQGQDFVKNADCICYLTSSNFIDGNSIWRTPADSEVDYDQQDYAKYYKCEIISDKFIKVSENDLNLSGILYTLTDVTNKVEKISIPTTGLYQQFYNNYKYTDAECTGLIRTDETGDDISTLIVQNEYYIDKSNNIYEITGYSYTNNDPSGNPTGYLTGGYYQIPSTSLYKRELEIKYYSRTFTSASFNVDDIIPTSGCVTEYYKLSSPTSASNPENLSTFYQKFICLDENNNIYEELNPNSVLTANTYYTFESIVPITGEYGEYKAKSGESYYKASNIFFDIYQQHITPLGSFNLDKTGVYSFWGWQTYPISSFFEYAPNCNAIIKGLSQSNQIIRREQNGPNIDNIKIPDKFKNWWVYFQNNKINKINIPSSFITNSNYPLSRYVIYWTYILPDN